eukprot:7758577-Pyramimonas_sp.AAC.1
MEAVRTGAGREPFLNDLRTAMQTLPIHSYLDWDSPDTIFEGIEKCIHDEAAKHFGAKQGHGEPYTSYAAERRRLLRRRIELRGQKQEATEEVTTQIDTQLNEVSKLLAAKRRKYQRQR